MSPDKQRKAIALACGWHCSPVTWWTPNGGAWARIADSSRDIPDSEILPNYLEDLNAMHEAERILTVGQCYEYSSRIGELLGDWIPENKASTWPFHAHAGQRAEAFLRTIGKWEDAT